MKLTRYRREKKELLKILQLRLQEDKGWEDIDIIMQAHNRPDEPLRYKASDHGKGAWRAVAAAVIMLGPDCEAKMELRQFMRNLHERRLTSKPSRWLQPVKVGSRVQESVLAK